MVFPEIYHQDPRKLKLPQRPAVLENMHGFDVESIKPDSPVYRKPNRLAKVRLGSPRKPHGHKKI